MNKELQAGFTLIELVVVMVILGILAAVAIPQFVDLRADARTARIEGVAGVISSASAVNYASCQVAGAGATVVANCGALSTLVTGVPVASVANAAAVAASVAAGNYVLQQDEALTDGNAGTCTLTDPDAGTTTFSGIGAAGCT